MKKLLTILIAAFPLISIYGQVDYRDYATGYYQCSVIHGLVGVDTTHYTESLTVNILAEPDSFVRIGSAPNSYWDFLLKPDSTLKHNYQAHVYYYYSFIRTDTMHIDYVEEKYFAPFNEWVPYYTVYN